jgi:hypothetical protein
MIAALLVTGESERSKISFPLWLRLSGLPGLPWNINLHDYSPV